MLNKFFCKTFLSKRKHVSRLSSKNTLYECKSLKPDKEISETYMDLAKEIDRRARIFFPSLFFAFSLIYWCHFKILSKELDKHLVGATTYVQDESMFE